MKIRKIFGKMYVPLPGDNLKVGLHLPDVVRMEFKDDHWHYKNAKFPVLGRPLETCKLA